MIPLTEVKCRVCGRQIIIENGRFTAHSDGRKLGEKQIPQCPAAGKLARAASANRTRP